MRKNRKTTYTSLALTAFATLFLTACASQKPAPIEGIGPESPEQGSGETVQTSALSQSQPLDSASLNPLQGRIYNPGAYSQTEQQAMMQALGNMRCQTVHFAFDSTTLTSEAKACLNQVADYLVQYKQPIRLAGHTDPRGSEKYNLNLGQRRADSVSQYLMQQGVAQAQICAVSYGESQPAANPKQFYSDMCSKGENSACREKAKARAYYLDRRTVLNFGQKCG